MVGNDAVRDIPLTIDVGVRHVGRRLDKRAHHVDVVIVVLALKHGRNPLQPHAGVDRRLGQQDALVGGLLELHEDEVPDLDESVTILVGRTGWTARE